MYLKKHFFLLTVACFSATVSSNTIYAGRGVAYQDSAQFDPETASFSKMETLKTWVAPQYRQYLNGIQHYAALSVLENPFSMRFALPVQNAPGVTQYFGKTFPTISSIELPFLQHVRNVSEKKAPLTLELAAGIGFVSWKVPLAFGLKGGKHYVNDLSLNAMSDAYDQVINNRFGALASYRSTLHKLPGSCFDIPQQRPEIMGKVDAIYVQNLDHFFNPEQHQRYLTLLTDLLAPGGKAFLCAHSFQFKQGDPLHSLYLEQKKKKDPYPGFGEYDIKFVQVVGNEFQFDNSIISNAIRPVDNALFEKREIAPPRDINPILHPQMGPLQLQEFHQRVTGNAFSPAIYKGLLEKRPEIQLIDTFFIDREGKRAQKWGENVSHAAVIFEKK